VIAFEIRWEVTDRAGQSLGELRGRGGTMLWDGRASIQRVARDVVFDRADFAAVNPLTDCLRPLYVTEDGTSQPLGLFVVASDVRRYDRNPEPEPARPYLADLGWLLEQQSPYALSGAPGQRLADAIQQVCDRALVLRYRIESADELIGSPIGFPPGATYREALESLAELAGFLPPHFDRDGVLRFRPPPATTEPAQVSYGRDSIVAATRVEETNLLTSPNTFLVVGSGGTAGPVTAVAEVDANLPNSVANRDGVRVVKVVAEQGVDSAFQADRLAKLLALKASAQYRTFEFGSVPNPAHDAFTIVGVNDVSCVEWRWSLGLRPGDVMTHLVYSTFEVVREY